MQADDIIPPYGAYRLSAPAEALRHWASARAPGRVGRMLSSAVRRACIVGRADPFDLEIFPEVRARLYPRTNRCEKVVFAGPQFWDFEERRILEAAIRSADATRPFVFIDIGANVGLYTLCAARAGRAAGRLMRMLAVEPDAENRRRLEANLRINAVDAAEIVAVAVAGEAGLGALSGGDINRGERRLATNGAEADVEVATIAQILARKGVERLDAMKIDIEGHDLPALSAFFAAAPGSLLPDLLIAEAGRGDVPALAELCRAHGYELTARTRLNAIFRRAMRAVD